MKLSQLRARSMTSGNIYKHLCLFSVPLLIGNLFQLLYNTVDAVVVGRFVSTEALAAIGATGMVINVLVYFFMGFSVGAGVLIGQCFGAKNEESIHEAVETTIAVTLILCFVITLIGYFGTTPMLRLINVPADVFGEAEAYLRIYFLGISGLLIYNIGGAVLRSVGNSIIPLYFLIFSSVLNIVLDLLFVIAFGFGVEGVAWATVIAQFASAALIILLLTKTPDIYRLSWRDLHINREQLRTIVNIGLPAGIQMVITAFANLVAQSYVNSLGAECMAGVGCFNKLLSFALLPMSAFANATTTFVSQNVGAKQFERTREGIHKSNMLNLGFSLVISILMFVFAEQLTGIYTTDEKVIYFGALFMHWVIFSIIYYSLGNNITAAMVGLKDSKGPTLIKLVFFVGMRLAFLYLATAFMGNTPEIVALTFPVSWGLGTIALLIYYNKRWKNYLLKGV